MTPAVSWRPFDPADFIGVNDPYTLTPLEAGEVVRYCDSCKLGYHASTIDFLLQANDGRCAHCNVPNRWITVELPGGKPEIPVPVPAQAPSQPDGAAVTLAKIWDHVDQIVTFEGYVHTVFQSRSTGTWFVKFEQTRTPLEGFRLVIWSRYTSRWTDRGLDIRAYEGKTIRVRGLIRDDPNYGIQMLIDGPDAISVPTDAVPDQRIIWKASTP
ncbi:MAG: hypothetical protein ACKOWF_19240 [Chloroflexota bacterium]